MVTAAQFNDWYDNLDETEDELDQKIDRHPSELHYSGPPTETSIGFIRSVEDNGGEGQGDHCEVTVELTGPDSTVQFFKIEGYYNSWEGSTWSWPWYEAEPYEFTETRYKEKK